MKSSSVFFPPPKPSLKPFLKAMSFFSNHPVGWAAPLNLQNRQ
jgi:hypothetical protein